MKKKIIKERKKEKIIIPNKKDKVDSLKESTAHLCGTWYIICIDNIHISKHMQILF